MPSRDQYAPVVLCVVLAARQQQPALLSTQVSYAIEMCGITYLELTQMLPRTAEDVQLFSGG